MSAIKILFSVFGLFVGASLVHAMVPFSFWKVKCSPPLAATWTPAWGNIIQYWPLNGSGAIADGATVAASIGTNGTMSGTGASYIASKVGNGVKFTGGQYITMGALANMQGLAKVTMAAWAYPTAAVRGTVIGTELQIKIQYTDTQTFRVLISSDNSSWSAIVETSATYALNQWYHLVAVYDGAQLVFYVNGVSQGSWPLTGNVATTGTEFQISGFQGINEVFTGRIDEVAVWNTGLSADQVLRLYQGQTCTP